MYDRELNGDDVAAVDGSTGRWRGEARSGLGKDGVDGLKVWRRRGEGREKAVK